MCKYSALTVYVKCSVSINVSFAFYFMTCLRLFLGVLSASPISAAVLPTSLKCKNFSNECLDLEIVCRSTSVWYQVVNVCSKFQTLGKLKIDGLTSKMCKFTKIFYFWAASKLIASLLIEYDMETSSLHMWKAEESSQLYSISNSGLL